MAPNHFMTGMHMRQKLDYMHILELNMVMKYKVIVCALDGMYLLSKIWNTFQSCNVIFVLKLSTLKKILLLTY